MRSTGRVARVRVARMIEASGGLLWLGAAASMATGPADAPMDLAIAVLGMGGVLCGLGLEAAQWNVLGRGGRAAVAVATVGSAAMLGPWVMVLGGIVATLAGTALAAMGQLRGPARAPSLGLPLLVGAVVTVGVLPGTVPWIACAFGLGHVAAAAAGDRPWGHWAGPAAGAGSAAALTAIVAGVAVGSGAIAIPRDTGQPARTGPLPQLAVVVDTDMQPDDWLALLYLSSEPDVEIRAVTVDAGAVIGCAAGVGIARDLLAAVGQANVPVACGPPVAPGGTPFPSAWSHDVLSVAASLGWTPDDGDPAGWTFPSGDAVDVLRAAIAAGPVTIVSLGPPTNIAALLADPTWDRRNVARLVQMAGAVDVAGNVETLPAVEWNAAVDPHALAAVLASGLDITLVSLDGTNDVPVRTVTIDRWTADQSTPAASLAGRVLETQRTFAASGGYYAWDVLTAVVAREPGVVRTSRANLRVSMDPAEAGRTVRDPAGSAVLVALDADTGTFERIFLDAIRGRAR